MNCSVDLDWTLSCQLDHVVTTKSFQIQRQWTQLNETFKMSGHPTLELKRKSIFQIFGAQIYLMDDIHPAPSVILIWNMGRHRQSTRIKPLSVSVFSIISLIQDTKINLPKAKLVVGATYHVATHLTQNVPNINYGQNDLRSILIQNVPKPIMTKNVQKSLQTQKCPKINHCKHAPEPIKTRNWPKTNLTLN